MSNMTTELTQAEKDKAQAKKDKAGADKRQAERAQRAANSTGKAATEKAQAVLKLAATVGAHGPNAMAIGLAVGMINELAARVAELEAKGVKSK